jgi:hypothetical protein
LIQRDESSWGKVGKFRKCCVGGSTSMDLCMKDWLRGGWRAISSNVKKYGSGGRLEGLGGK